MIRKRFSSWRIAKIIGVTASMLTWSAALLAELLGFPTAGAATLPAAPAESEAITVAPTTVQVAPSLPDLPEGKLLIIRTARLAEPQPIVRRVVVQQSSPAAAPATLAPQKRTQSAGS
jgi:hypothetical protein